MASSPYKLVGKLPPRVAFASRYKAHHALLDRAVEFRFERARGDEAGRELFHREREELGRVDHPCFLPLMDRGALRGRQGYVVPFREHRTVVQMIRAKDFFLPQAAACVRSLATGLAAAHEAGFHLGAISPKHVAWSETAGGAYFLHHRMGAPRYMQDPGLALPADVWPSAPSSPAGDVFHWGFFSYFLLTRGARPYAEGPTFQPLAELCPQVSSTLAMVVEAALSVAPRDRPEDGMVLGSVLRTEGLELAPKSEDVVLEAEAPTAAVTFQATVAGLGELRRTTGAWMEGDADDSSLDAAPRRAAAGGEAAGGDPAEGAGGRGDEAGDAAAPSEEAAEPAAAPPSEEHPVLEPGAAADDPDASSEALDLGQFESSAIPAMASVPASRSDPRALLEAVPGSVVAVVTGLVVVALGLVLTDPGGGYVPPPPPREEVGTGLAPDGSLVPLSRAQARRYQLEPQVRELLKLRTVTPERFPRVLARLQALARQRRLPPALRDGTRLQDVGTLYSKYPEQGARELERFLDDLRTVLGEAEARGTR